MLPFGIMSLVGEETPQSLASRVLASKIEDLFMTPKEGHAQNKHEQT